MAPMQVGGWLWGSYGDELDAGMVGSRVCKVVIDVDFSCMRVSRDLGLLKGGLGGMLSGHAMRFGCMGGKVVDMEDGYGGVCKEMAICMGMDGRGE